MPWLFAYDISDPRRLCRVHRRMLRHAMPIEYSVFWLEGTERARDARIADVVPHIDCDEDDLRLYPMPADGWRRRLGRAALPSGITWTALPSQWMV